jgi:hypothetical protein
MLELVLDGLVASGRKIEGKIEAIAVIFASVFEPALKIEAFITAIAAIFASVFEMYTPREQALQIITAEAKSICQKDNDIMLSVRESETPARKQIWR